MAFDNLSSRLQMALRRVTGKGRLNENDIELMMREVRLSLLEADVNYKVVKEFTREVKEKSLGEKILKGLNPGQQVVKVVHEELKKLMGSEASDLALKMDGLTKIMMVGLQGAGKTTATGKLASFLRKNRDKKPLLIAADVYRPAAIEQLVTIGKQINIPVFEQGIKEKPTKIVENGIKFALDNDYDLVIIDTAGRLHIDETMMQELVDIKELVKPEEVILVVDAMTGQDAVNVANSFYELLNVSGCILTKLDGDTRGGAALSIRKVTGVPIKFAGVGEKLDQLEIFHPERMASRILGMGDMLTFIEKATENIDEDEALNVMEKMMSGKFNYNDLLKQMKMIKRMGSLGGILKMIPGAGKALRNTNVDEKQLVYIECIINSMTKEERKKPELISRSSSRRRRIVNGSGRSMSEINKLIQQLDAQKKVMKSFSGASPTQMNKMANDFQSGRMPNIQTKGKTKKGKGKGKGGFRF